MTSGLSAALASSLCPCMNNHNQNSFHRNLEVLHSKANMTSEEKEKKGDSLIFRVVGIGLTASCIHITTVLLRES